MNNGKNKWMKRGVALLLIVSMCIGNAVTGVAAEFEGKEISPMSIDTASKALLEIIGGTATGTCTVSGVAKTITKISITMYLEKHLAGSSWVTLKTWSGSASNYYYKLQKSCAVSQGTYRIKAKIVCYQGTTSETTYRYSDEKTY